MKPVIKEKKEKKAVQIPPAARSSAQTPQAPPGMVLVVAALKVSAVRLTSATSWPQPKQQG